MHPTHIRFDSDEDDPATLAPPTPAPFAGDHRPTTGAVQLQCVSTVRTDFSDDRCYVLHLAFAPGSSTDFAAACSNNLVKLYRISESKTVHLRECVGHESTVTSLAFLQPHVLATSSYDGTVRTWDARNGQQIAKCVCHIKFCTSIMLCNRFTAGRYELFSCTVGGDHHLAAGTDGRVLFWDARTNKQLLTFADTHAGDVTQVLFHPDRPNLLISGSVDGLIAVHDVAVGPLDEDEGFCAAVNLETSVAGLGAYGQRLWCTSGTEGLYLWDVLSACQEDDAGGSGVAAECSDARAVLGGSGGAPLPAVDYLISALWDGEQLLLGGGTQAGAVGLFPVADAAPLLGAPPVATCAAGPHEAMVRAAVLVPGVPGMMMTGGEDSRVCVWAAGSVSEGQPRGEDRVVRKLRGQRHTPY